MMRTSLNDAIGMLNARHTVRNAEVARRR